MKKILALVGLVALFGLGMAMSDVTLAQEDSFSGPSTIAVQGTIISTGSCVAVQTCSGGSIYNLVGLPASYTVGDEVELKGILTAFTTICYPTYFTINIGKIRLKDC